MSKDLIRIAIALERIAKALEKGKLLSTKNYKISNLTEEREQRFIKKPRPTVAPKKYKPCRLCGKVGPSYKGGRGIGLCCKGKRPSEEKIVAPGKSLTNKTYQQKESECSDPDLPTERKSDKSFRWTSLTDEEVLSLAKDAIKDEEIETRTELRVKHQTLVNELTKRGLFEKVGLEAKTWGFDPRKALDKGKFWCYGCKSYHMGGQTVYGPCQCICHMEGGVEYEHRKSREAKQ